MSFLFIFVSLGVYIREVEDPFWDVKSRSLEDLRPVSDFIGWKVFVKEEGVGDEPFGCCLITLLSIVFHIDAVRKGEKG